MKKVIRIGFGIVILLFVAFMTWYKIAFSMDVASAKEINPNGQTHLLIATQGSAFKEKLTQIIIDHFNSSQTHIKVIDVSDLRYITEEEWDCIVLVHTWELSRPPSSVKHYIDSWKSPGKHVVVTTSGAGNYQMDKVDAITCASEIDKTNEIATATIQKIDAILQ